MSAPGGHRAWLRNDCGPPSPTAHRPFGGEVVAADQAEGLAELRPHQRRRAEHQAGDELLDKLLCGNIKTVRWQHRSTLSDKTTIVSTAQYGSIWRAALLGCISSRLRAAVISTMHLGQRCDPQSHATASGSGSLRMQVCRARRCCTGRNITLENG